MDTKRPTVNILLFLICFSAVTGVAKEIVVNDGFELQDISYWEFSGTIPPWEYGVIKVDVTGDGCSEGTRRPAGGRGPGHVLR